MKVAIVACALLLGACAHGQRPPPEPVIRTIEVQVPVIVPCKALVELDDSLSYPDTPTALRAAPNIFERVRLILQGRELRAAQLQKYRAAKGSC